MSCVDPTCTACPLHLQCKTVCVPATWLGQGLDWPEESGQTIYDRALYIVGEAPGYNEDQEGKPWVGQAGRILKKLYLEYFGLPDQVDIFLSNAVRCRPTNNKTPNKSQLKACQGFYLADIVMLQKLYDEVVVLCCGAPAVQSVLGMSLKKSFTRQGNPADFRTLTAPTPKSIVLVGEIVGPYLSSPTLPPFPRPCPVFTTYHPAAVGRDKAKGLLIAPHMKMVSDYFKGELTYAIKGGSLDIQLCPKPPGYPLTHLSLDIETYGILKGQTQKMFHPLKSMAHDGILRERLCVTTGLSWYAPSGELEHAVFIMTKETHRRRLWSWIRKCHTESLSSSSTTTKPFQYLIGQNLKFDLMYLRHAYPECKVWLNHPLPLVDLIVTNYLYHEGRPERSLKALAPLLRVTQYGQGFTQYPSETDSNLIQYNCQDTAATILSQRKLEDLIATLYGKDSPKLSSFNREWYSKLLWLTIWMEETGVAMDEGALQGLLKSYEARAVKLERGIKSRWGINLRGKGSQGHKQEIMNLACQTLLKAGSIVPPLQKTTEKKEISFKEENRNTLLDVLPAQTMASKQLRAVGSVHTVGGILDRYLYPLLVGRGKAHTDLTTRLIEGIAYPRWYPVPSDWEDGSGGGTKQCRIVAKGPACQTFPPAIKKCITSRYGSLLWFDYSQIELRVAALLSGDPWMMGEYAKDDCDFHLATAARLFGDKDAKKYRQIGKTLNFLVIYLGGAERFQSTLMRDVGVARSLPQCAKDIREWWKAATGLRRWQLGLYKYVRRHGYFDLPLAGQSRLFMGNKWEVREMMKEIVNMPVQAVAANIMLSAQFELQWVFKKRNLKAILPLNVYDAASIEFPKTELYAVRQEMARILPDPPYYQALCKILGRRLPLKYDIKESC